jgi:hypothetical protein
MNPIQNLLLNQVPIFQPMDLIAPIGITLVALTLCTWGSLSKSAKLPAKIICILTGLMFVGATGFFYNLRSQRTKIDYETHLGSSVSQGTKNQCLKDSLNSWEQEVLTFWLKQNLNEDCLRSMLSRMIVVCSDQPILTSANRFVYGYSNGSAIVLGVGINPKAQSQHVKSLYGHEAGHHLLTFCSEMASENEQHNFMANVNYPFK